MPSHHLELGIDGLSVVFLLSVVVARADLKVNVGSLAAAALMGFRDDPNCVAAPDPLSSVTLASPR